MKENSVSNKTYKKCLAIFAFCSILTLACSSVSDIAATVLAIPTSVSFYASMLTMK